MIEKIKLGSANNQYTPQQNGKGKMTQNQQPSFGGLGDGLISAVQLCEKHPMVNVSVLDLATAIVPRSIIETYSGSKKTDENGNEKRELNVYAGMEAFRRESSGLIVNCLIPSFIVMGLAKVLQRPVMGEFGKSSLVKSWADGSTLDKVHSFYKSAGGEGKQKIVNTLKDTLFAMRGVDGKEEKAFEELFKSAENSKILKGALDTTADEIMKAKPDGKAIDKAFRSLVDITHISENIKFKGEGKFFSNSFESIWKNMSKTLHGVVTEDIKDEAKLAKYFSKAKKLVNVKSLAGMGVIIPLAISMQPINRWITRKSSGKKGAPIYSDFKDRKEDQELSPKDKADLLKQKFISVGSMIGVALLSMMKMPNMSMFQFKGLFPSMDQARIISTATFASRMAAAEDKNELREATIRDIATFSSFYFLGDYAAKAIATGIEANNKDAKLLNKLKPLDKDANVFKKFWNWVKHTSLKSTDELSTVKDKKLRTICQIGNLAFSLIALGIFIPLYTRTQTNKKRQEELAKIQAEQLVASSSSASPATGAAEASALQSSAPAKDTGDNETSESSSADEFSKTIVKDSSTTFKAFFNS